MSIQKTRQVGGDEPLPQAALELQQIAVGMFLTWDALGDQFESREFVERKILGDWAHKHKVGQQTAIGALLVIKKQLMDEHWAHYIHCRDFKKEGWSNMLAFTPDGNQDVLDQIKSILDSRPFPEPAL